MTCTANFELGVLGATIQTTDPGSATPWDAVTAGLNSTPLYDNAHVHTGALAAKLQSGVPTPALSWTAASFGTLTEHYGRTYLYIGTRSNTISLFNFAKSGTNRCGAVMTQTNYNLNLRDAASTVRATSATVFVINTWYRLDWHVKHGTGVGSLFEVEIYIGANVDGNTPDDSVSMAGFNIGADADTFNIGNLSVGNSDIFWVDDIVAAAPNWPGPAGVLADPTLGMLRPIVHGGFS